MIYETEGGFVISSHCAWVPGVYEDRKAANYAFQFKNKDLQDLQDQIGKRFITSKDLKDLKRLERV